MLKLRRERQGLHFGRINLLSNLPKNILAFERIYQDEQLLTLINFVGETIDVTLDQLKTAELLLNTRCDNQILLTANQITLRPNEGILLTIQ